MLNTMQKEQKNQGNQQVILRDNVYLRMRTIKIIFPSGYQFALKVPQQIKVFQITQIIRNYSILHQVHGLKVEGAYLQPLFLSSVRNNFIVDTYMSDQNCANRQMSCIAENQFKVEYSFREYNDKNISNKSSPVRNYQIIGKLQIESQQNIQGLRVSQFIYIARNRINCKLYILTRIDKNHLNFYACQKIILLTSYIKRAGNDRNNQFVDIYQCFQTQKSFFIVKQFHPFQLIKLKINDKFLMDLVLTQIARTLHILQRDQIQIDSIQLSDFWIDFRLGIHFFSIQKLNFMKKKADHIIFLQDNQSNLKSSTIFNERMVIIIEQLFKSCNMRLIQTYIHLFQWFKNGRINNYLQFLKYSRIQPNTVISRQNQDKIERLISLLINDYKNIDKLIEIDDNQFQQFKKDYQAKTKIFYLQNHQKKDGVQQNTGRLVKFCDMNQSIFQNISTVKKKMKQKINQPKPTYEAGYYLKKRKNKKNQKSKSFSLNHKAITNKARRENKISQFLIDD